MSYAFIDKLENGIPVVLFHQKSTVFSFEHWVSFGFNKVQGIEFSINVSPANFREKFGKYCVEVLQDYFEQKLSSKELCEKLGKSKMDITTYSEDADSRFFKALGGVKTTLVVEKFCEIYFKD